MKTKEFYYDYEGNKHTFEEYGVEFLFETGNYVVVQGKKTKKYTIWSERFNRPLCAWLDDDELEPKYFDTLQEVVDYINGKE